MCFWRWDGRAASGPERTPLDHNQTILCRVRGHAMHTGGWEWPPRHAASCLPTVTQYSTPHSMLHLLSFLPYLTRFQEMQSFISWWITFCLLWELNILSNTKLGNRFRAVFQETFLEEPSFPNVNIEAEFHLITFAIISHLYSLWKHIKMSFVNECHQLQGRQNASI